MRKRVHLFEFGDQPWLPATLRAAETAYMVAAYRMTPLPKLWAQKIATVLPSGEPAEILDLCSGAGGAMPLILAELEKLGYKTRAKLTDIYPNPQSSSPANITWVPEPVDATRVPATLAGVRTMFSAFHHFRPASAKAILKDAFHHRRAICIFESGSGTALTTAAMFVLVPVNVFLLMPFARPFRWSYLLFTYLIPVIPLMILFDGLVSNHRVYSDAEMRELIDDLQAPGYGWEIGSIHVRGLPASLPYLIGRPAAQA